MLRAVACIDPCLSKIVCIQYGVGICINCIHIQMRKALYVMLLLFQFRPVLMLTFLFCQTHLQLPALADKSAQVLIYSYFTKSVAWKVESNSVVNIMG